jgi:hypothetical protein
LALFDPLTLARSEEHVPQKILPQLRQWCRRKVTLNGDMHPRHALTSASRSQTRPYLADFFEVYDSRVSRVSRASGRCIAQRERERERERGWVELETWWDNALASVVFF